MTTRRLHVSPGLVSALEFVLLGPLAAVLVLVAIPRAFEIESSCLGATGAVGTDGDTYVGAMVTLGTLGWLAAFLGVVYASIVEQRSLVVLLPALCFAGLVLLALVAAPAVGPALCPTS